MMNLLFPGGRNLARGGMRGGMLLVMRCGRCVRMRGMCRRGAMTLQIKLPLLCIGQLGTEQTHARACYKQEQDRQSQVGQGANHSPHATSERDSIKRGIKQ